MRRMCLVCTQVVGYLLLRPTQAQAVLPPPLPSTAPFRMYVEALAVLPGHRRQGVASALLSAAARLGIVGAP
jgi:ribosomal protein S18 acetylase RimI-like enzyme